MYTPSTKREIRHFNVVVVKQRQRNVQKKRDARAKLLFCQSNPIAFLPFSLPSPSSLLKLSKAIYGEASPQGPTPYPFIHNF